MNSTLYARAFGIMEGTLKQVSITWRIAILVGIALAGLATVSATYFAGNAALESVNEQRHQAEKLMELVSATEAGALNMRRREKDFLLRMDEKYLAAYEEDAEAVAEALNQLAALPIAEEMSGPIGQLRDALPAHRAQMKNVGALYT